MASVAQLPPIVSTRSDDLTEALSKLRQRIHVVQLPAGESVCHQGAPIAGIHLLYEGCVKLEHMVLSGKRFLINVIYPVSVINYCALGDEEVYQVSSKTVRRSAVGFVLKETYFEWLMKQPALYVHQMKQFARRMAWKQRRLGQVAYSSVRDQLLMLLFELSQCRDTALHGMQDIEIDLSEQELAEMVGATRETVVRELTRLKRLGLISVRGRTILVRDKMLLSQAIAQADLIA